MHASIVAALALTSFAATARAESDDLVARPLVLARGELDAQLVTEINLDVGLIGRPLSLAPDVWIGIAPRWTVGLVHSNASVDRIDASASFCVRQLDAVCERTYRGSGIDVRYGARSGALAIAPRARLLVRDIDPVKPALALGALVRWTRGRFLVAADPYLRVGLANSEHGNRALLALPVWLGVQPTCRWLLALHTGWDAELAVWRDGWHGPLSVIVRARATAHVELGVEAGFPSLFGPQNNHKARAALVTIGWRGQAF